jgi:hypothetical protein
MIADVRCELVEQILWKEGHVGGDAEQEASVMFAREPKAADQPANRAGDVGIHDERRVDGLDLRCIAHSDCDQVRP